MNSLQTAAASILLVLLCLGYVAPTKQQNYTVDPVSNYFAKPLVWNFTMSSCGLFRNETVLRPYFTMWPDSAKGVTFSYCCEYQPPGSILSPTSFKLSLYITESGKRLVPTPYYDLGLIDRVFPSNLANMFVPFKRDYVPNFIRGIPIRELSKYRPPLFCEVTDLYRLYQYRLSQASKLAVIISSIDIFVLLVLGYLWRCVQKPTEGMDRWEGWKWDVEVGELTLDMVHLWLLALVGCYLREAIGHTDMSEWRSQFMYMAWRLYLPTLNLVASFNAVARHATHPAYRLKADEFMEWQWKKVCVQLAAAFMMRMYLLQVEDVSGRRLDGVAGLVLGGVLGAAGFSLLEADAFHVAKMIAQFEVRQPKKCPKCRTPMCETCRNQS